MPISFKPHSCKLKSWTNFFLLGCMVTSTSSAVAQALGALFTTRQDELFKESYRLPVLEGVLDYPWMSAIVDYDNDGSLDIILYGHHSSDAYIWRGARNNAEYLPKGSWIFGVRDPIWLDIDDDGDIDGIGTEGTYIAKELFINQGNGNFALTKQPYWLPMSDLKQIATFLPMPSHIPAAKHPLDAKLTKAHYVDLNNDGKAELIASMTGQITFPTATGTVTKYSGYSWVFENRDGVWTDVTASLGLREGLEQQFLPEDIDMDGDLDIVDLFAENVYRNEGYVFTKVNTAPVFGGRRPYDGDGELDVIDIDNNGYRDLIFGGDHSTASGTFLSNGNFSFQRLEGSIIRTSRRERKFADLDRDGDIDMVAYNGKEMVVYDNVTPYRGIHVTFAGDYFGTQVQVKDNSNKLIFNVQLFQHQNSGMSQVYVNSVHVGGITAPVQAFVKEQATGGFIPSNIIDGPDTNFTNGILQIVQVEVEGAIYSVKMQYSDPAIAGFSLTDIRYVSTVEQAGSESGTYLHGVLSLPVVRIADKKYEAKLLLVEGSSPVKFVLQSSTPLP